MNDRLTSKQEAFAQAVFRGAAKRDAYLEAYPACMRTAHAVSSAASALLRKPKVARRIEDLRKPVLQKLAYDFEKAMIEAGDALEMARDARNAGAMVAAVTLRAKLAGLLVDRKEVRTGPLDGLPVSELEALDEAVSAIRKAREGSPGRMT